MDILLISYWDFQDHGMQVTKRTPLYFAQQGHKVTFMVHSEMTNKPSKIDNLHPNVKVLRFDMPFKWLNKIPKLKRIRHLALFGIFCFYHSMMIYRRGKKPSIIYSAECDAILIGTVLHWIFSVPLITRYYGISTQLLEHPYKFMLYALSLRCPADMAIVTNDGTNALNLLRRVNNKIKEFCFWQNGIDRPIFNRLKTRYFRQKYQIPDNHVVFLTNSRLYGWKRVDRAIRTMELLVNKNLPVTLLVVGNGPEEYRLKELSVALGVDTAVVFTGPVKHEDIYNIYAIADVLFSFYEMSNVGNPLWEAINVGLCIVTLNTGSTDEIISDGHNGRLIEIECDEDTLIMRISDVVEELVNNSEYRQRLAAGAKVYGRKNLWTWDERLKTELNSIYRLLRDRAE